MRIKSIDAKNILPITHFEVNNLSNIVVIAGPNGVGKTRLTQAVINKFQNLNSSPQLRLVIEATTNEEKKNGKKIF